MAFKIAEKKLSGLRRRILQREYAAVIDTRADGRWQIYAGLLPTSVTLAGIKLGRIERHVNLMLPEIGAATLFAGIRTALACATMMARELGWPLRIISYGPLLSGPESDEIRHLLQEEMGIAPDRVRFLSGWRLDGELFSNEDVWTATYWTTAHALDVACRLELLDASRVVYLVQDYEPGFFAGSTESAMAQSTYHAGFELIVNSKPLHSFLESREGIRVDAGRVFRPELDLDRLEMSSRHRRASPQINVAFYGRPSKPRNLFRLGVASIRAAQRTMDSTGFVVSFLSMGEKHAPISLGKNQTMRSVGKVSWSKYFELLARTDVMFSLQESPHPSHPPLDSVASGAFSVTNEMGGTRAGLSPRLFAVDTDPDALGAAVVSAARTATEEGHLDHLDQEFVERLGTPLHGAVSATLKSIF